MYNGSEKFKFNPSIVKSVPRAKVVMFGSVIRMSFYRLDRGFTLLVAFFEAFDRRGGEETEDVVEHEADGG